MFDELFVRLVLGQMVSGSMVWDSNLGCTRPDKMKVETFEQLRAFIKETRPEMFRYCEGAW